MKIGVPTEACKTACPALNGPRLLCFPSLWFCLFSALLSTINYLQQFFLHLHLLAVVFWRLECWGRSSRRCDCLFMGDLDPGTLRLLTLSPVLGMWVPLAFSAPRACRKDVALRW